MWACHLGHHCAARYFINTGNAVNLQDSDEKRTAAMRKAEKRPAPNESKDIIEVFSTDEEEEPMPGAELEGADLSCSAYTFKNAVHLKSCHMCRKPKPLTESAEMGRCGSETPVGDSRNFATPLPSKKRALEKNGNAFLSSAAQVARC